MPADETERIGYPTQKPLELLQRIIEAGTNPGEVVADFFCGGGATLAAALGQRVVRDKNGTKRLSTDTALARRWIGCDVSRVAVAITADRVARLVEEHAGRVLPVPDFTVEHWGVYEARRLSEAPADRFREFVLRAFGASPDNSQEGIHGRKGAVPVWVGEPDQRYQVTARDVQEFANAIRRTIAYQQANLRDGMMLAWAFRPDAREAADRLRELEQTDLNFVRLDMIRIDSLQFREHVAALSTDHADYESFLTFVQPPRVHVGWKSIGARTYRFDVSETAVLNTGAQIVNVQWDFNHGTRFSSTHGYSFTRGTKREPALQADYQFSRSGRFRIACKVQDDMGGEGIWNGEVEVN